MKKKIHRCRSLYEVFKRMIYDIKNRRHQTSNKDLMAFFDIGLISISVYQGFNKALEKNKLTDLYFYPPR